MIEKDPDHCPKSKSGKHVPDMCSFHADWEGDAVYIDVNCELCGRSGCVGRLKLAYGTDEIEVDW